MDLKHLRGIDQDHRRQYSEARKMGGPSDTLRKTMRRPESMSHARWGTIALLHSGPELESDKCKCGKDKFKYQKVCGECYLNK